MDRFSFVLGICLIEFLAMVWLWAYLSVAFSWCNCGVGPTNIIRSRILFGCESVR